MRAIHLVTVGASGAGGPEVELGLLDRLSAALARVFFVSCHVRTEVLDATMALDPSRLQYHSTAILSALAGQADPDIRLLGITGLDLFVPVLTYVFGEAQLQGNCGLVSIHRLREEYYGLPPNPALLAERLLKEALHEIGHTFGLRHCSDWRCVMASTHSVERLDVKEARYCLSCLRTVAS